MGLFISMKKISETDKDVRYEFDMVVVDKEYYIPEEVFPYKVDSHRAYGYGTLDKVTEEFTVDEAKTDPFFLEHKMYSAIVGGTLIKILRSGKEFPELTSFAS